MNIYAKHGDKVIVTEASYKAGDKASDNTYLHLEVGKVYTVEYTDVHNWHTDVYIKEVPEVAFNSVNFEDYTDSLVCDVCKHWTPETGCTHYLPTTLPKLVPRSGDLPLYVKTTEDMQKHILRLDKSIQENAKRECIQLSVANMEHVSVSHIRGAETVRIGYGCPEGTQWKEVSVKMFGQLMRALLADTTFERSSTTD